MRPYLNTLLVSAVILLTTFVTNGQNITTFAGNGTVGYSGDGGPATAASLNGPFGVAIDNNGNIFIGDTGNHVVRKINASGIITTVAGNHIAGYSGDGGQATDARLFEPTGIATDIYGNLFIADLKSYVIRKVDISGIISTIAGTGSPTGTSGINGPATNAALGGPTSVAVDHLGNIFITNGYVLLKVNTAGIITTFAGSYTWGSVWAGPATNARLGSTIAIASDNYNNIYFSDWLNAIVLKVDTFGIITPAAGLSQPWCSGDGGPATNARINNSAGICFDGAGNLYIADTWDERIRQVNTSGIINTIAGVGRRGYSGDGNIATAAELNIPLSVVADNRGDVYISDNVNNVIRKVNIGTARTAQLTASNVVEIIPNPTNGSFTVKGYTGIPADKHLLIEIINSSGITVYHASTDMYNGAINCKIKLDNNLPAGKYFIFLRSESADISVSFLLQK